MSGVWLGDRVLILSTPYTRSHGELISTSIGYTGRVVDVFATPEDVTGFDAIYTVQLAGGSSVSLIAADFQLIERRARIRS